MEQFFADRNEQFKKTEFELELIKIVHCFLDGHGNYTSNSVSFKVKSLQTNHFLSARDLYKSIGRANDIIITPIKNPIAIKNAINKKLVPNVSQIHATHS